MRVDLHGYPGADPITQPHLDLFERPVLRHLAHLSEIFLRLFVLDPLQGLLLGSEVQLVDGVPFTAVEE